MSHYLKLSKLRERLQKQEKRKRMNYKSFESFSSDNSCNDDESQQILRTPEINIDQPRNPFFIGGNSLALPHESPNATQDEFDDYLLADSMDLADSTNLCPSCDDDDDNDVLCDTNSLSPTASTTPTGILSPLTNSPDVDQTTESIAEWLVFDVNTQRYRRPLQLEFLKLLLEKPEYHSYASWTNEADGEFQINQPESVVELWQRVKARRTEGKMTYDTFARGLRHNYQSHKMISTKKKFTFCLNKKS